MRKLTKIPMTELTDTELKEVAGGASNATTFDEGVVVKVHHSSPESMENGAIQNMNHFK